MNSDTNGAMQRNTAFGWVAVATGLILLIPLVAMQFTSEVAWNMADFVVMGAMLFGAGSAFVLASRLVPRKRIVIVGAAIALLFLWFWAELAVGIFTDWGN